MSLVAMLYQALTSYNLLPDTIASHFNASGQADGWSSKSSFFMLWALMIVVMNAWVPLTGPLIRKLPPSLVNIPNKNYWLSSPQRIEQLTAVIFTTMAGIFLGTNIIILVVMDYTIKVNLGQIAHLDTGLLLGATGLIIILSIAYLIYKLKK